MQLTLKAGKRDMDVPAAEVKADKSDMGVPTVVVKAGKSDTDIPTSVAKAGKSDMDVPTAEVKAGNSDLDVPTAVVKATAVGTSIKLLQWVPPYHSYRLSKWFFNLQKLTYDMTSLLQHWDCLKYKNLEYSVKFLLGISYSIFQWILEVLLFLLLLLSLTSPEKEDLKHIDLVN